ncbi:MAG: hypothetical protein K2M59_06075 [Muribaculaceae bacterium]|nr:hypothetical protein [Muribaculaceae bacterium]
MKPSYNRHYCLGAGKHKMIFETERKALNFIRFNAIEFESRNVSTPNRAYYCILCLGWHITALPHSEARIMDIHDRWLLHWLIAISLSRRIIALADLLITDRSLQRQWYI